jgi:hypothetical protein
MLILGLKRDVDLSSNSLIKFFKEIYGTGFQNIDGTNFLNLGGI